MVLAVCGSWFDSFTYACVCRPIQPKSRGLLHAASALLLANIGALFAALLAYVYYAEPATLDQFGDESGTNYAYWKVRAC
jgi:hypothetical protein